MTNDMWPLNFPGPQLSIFCTGLACFPNLSCIFVKQQSQPHQIEALAGNLGSCSLVCNLFFKNPTRCNIKLGKPDHPQDTRWKWKK